MVTNLFRRRSAQFRKVLLSLGRPSTVRALLLGVLPGYEHAALMKTIHPATVCDVGANKGQFSLLARIMWPECRVVAFEPLSRPARKFRALFAGDDRVKLHQVAIAVSAGKGMMHVSAREDSSSLLPISVRQTQFAPGTEEVGTEAVELVPLSDAVGADEIAAPALLKVDVQGYEADVLKGCEPLLARFDHIYCELSFRELYRGQALCDEILRWLDERGFRVTGVNALAFDRDGLAVQADFLFSRKALVS
jgi:FkbM family methyltransferase